MIDMHTKLPSVLSALVLTQLFLSSTLQANELTSKTTTQHGFALYDDLKYPAGFTHFDYVNPSAPKGGELKLMGFGTYDSLNPYTLKGMSPFNTPGQFMYGFSELNETLLAGTGGYLPSGDESQSAYGLLAETLTYPDDISWVQFTIRPEAHFHDGHPVDANDVVYSYHTLLNQGHPRFKQLLLAVESVSIVSEKVVQVEFKRKYQRANILRFGEMPILPQHFWAEKDFERASQIAPLLSGPYQIDTFDIGKSITLKRQADFWGKSLNIYKGRFNFDQVRIDYYRDQSIAFEAFKAGEFDLFYDYTAKNWASAYDFPALETGKVIKEEIAHKIPSGTQGFFFNTRHKLFADRKVRQALSLMFDFEWTNKSLFNGAYQRNHSYFPNSDFAASGPPGKQELALLTPFKKQLPAALFEQAFTLPVSTGNGRIRQQTKQALALLDSAGWNIVGGTLTHRDSKQAFEFEILLRQAGIQRVIMPYIKNLERLGIKATARLIDATQYKVRLDNFDYDMMTFVLSQGMAPSYEQRDYFHSSTRDILGGQNYAGIQHSAIDALLEKVLSANSRSELIYAMRAMDRVLLWQHYIVPNWHLSYHRLAYWDRFGRPEVQAPYKLGIENWWQKP